MTISRSETSIQHNDPFAPLYPHQFMSLTTFRKSGEAVATPVWFAPDGAGHIYLTTGTVAGKLKRIHNNAEVRMVASDAKGSAVDGQPPLSGYAREVLPEEHAKAEATLLQKYGEQYTAFIARIAGNSLSGRTYIEIRPEK